MSLAPIGRDIPLQIVFTDVNGVAQDLPGGVTLSATTTVLSTGTVVTYVYGGINPQDALMTHPATGTYQLLYSPTVASPVRWTIFTTGGAAGTQHQEQSGVVIVYDPAAYPAGFGYCDVTDVAGNISSGTWDPTLPGSAPNVARVQELILNTAVQIDMVLAKRGYEVPLVPSDPTKPIGIQAWNYLREINAALATGMVERERFASQGNSTGDSSYWATYGDDLLVRLDEGDDNLYLFNVASSGWAPVADPSLASSVYPYANFDGSPAAPLFTSTDQY